MRILIVSSYVLPHVGGVERFVATIRRMLEQRGAAVRVLACRRPGEDSTADALLPTRFVGSSGWPLPTGGLATLWREIGRADAVVANNLLHVLSDLAVLVARRRGVPALLVVHGSGAARAHESPKRVAARGGFERTLARLALRRSLPVSVSASGVEGIRGNHGIDAAYLPYPLPELAPAARPRLDSPLRVAWIGRLYPEKDPLLAVRAVEELRTRRPATLDVYGDGILHDELAALAVERSWLRLHGSRPWSEVLELQNRAHLCLSTSVWDNVQVAVLEALSRGVPVVSTRVGDAPRYYHMPDLGRFCVPAGDAPALAGALDEFASSAERYAQAFAVNGERVRAIHAEAPAILEELIAVAGRGRRIR
jgi:glycosyltransferase involved in cell wall biosynthesis